jgi:hypothetical protein
MAAPTFHKGQAVRHKETGDIWHVRLIIPANCNFGETILAQDYPTDWAACFCSERCFQPEEIEPAVAEVRA